MNNTDSVLFSPIKIANLELPGRLFKTATAETRASKDGYVTPEVVEFYELLAKGETPLIITGNIYISQQGKSAQFQLGADHDDKIPGLSEVVNVVHARGSKIFAQLNHCGRQIVPDSVDAVDVVSASGVKELMTGTKPRPLEIEEIHRIVEEFANAAERCQRAGFDGVQMHSSNGYLLSQFLTPYTNRRSDDYGGSLEKRTRFGREVYRAIRAKVGSDFPVILKLNGADKLPLRDGLKTPELVEIALIMEAEGINAIEISVGHYESGFPMVHGTFSRCLRNMVNGTLSHLPLVRRLAMRIFHPLVALFCNILWKPREGYNLDYSTSFTKQLKIPLICVGGFRTRLFMEQAIASGQCDAVSAGRPFIADPFFYRHTRDSQAGPKCVDCNACVGHIGAQPNDCYHPLVAAQKREMLRLDSITES